MDVVPNSDSPRRGKDLIRLICKRKKELIVGRSLLIQSSTYFAAMLSDGSGWEENSNRAIELESWPRNDLATILRSLKTKNAGPIFGDLNRYFTAINYFSIGPLMEKSIEFKLNNISDENVVEELEFAERFSISALRDKCMEFLLERLPEVLKNSRKSTRRMTAELLHKLLCHEKLTVRNEDEVLSLIDTWCSSGERQAERVKLLQEVRFAHLTEGAFEKCRQDAQCREVPQFRILLETSRWSDLGENFLSGRKLSRLHYHVVGFLKPRADGLLVNCSESGILSTARDPISHGCAEPMVDRSRSAICGNRLYVCQRTRKPYYVATITKVDTFTGIQYFSDFRDPAPSLTIQFPSLIFAAAPPAAFRNDLFIAHMTYKSKPTSAGWMGCVEAEHFDQLELLRYHNGTASSRILSVPIETASQPKFRRDLLKKAANTLLVNDEWTILLMPNQGVLLVFDSPHPVGPVIGIPEKSWKFEDRHMHKGRTCSDVVIAGNVAYVLVGFYMNEERWHPGDRDWYFFGEKQVGNVTAYDLTEGKWLPEHFLDLTTFFTERKQCNGFFNERFDISLKVVDNEVFVLFVTSAVEANDSPIPITPTSFVYRLQRLANKLCMFPASDSAVAMRDKRLKRFKKPEWWWEGIVVNVDAYPCKYATALQAKASREQDPIEREKLRCFIW